MSGHLAGKRYPVQIWPLVLTALLGFFRRECVVMIYMLSQSGNVRADRIGNVSGFLVKPHKCMLAWFHFDFQRLSNDIWGVPSQQHGIFVFISDRWMKIFFDIAHMRACARSGAEDL